METKEVILRYKTEIAKILHKEVADIKIYKEVFINESSKDKRREEFIEIGELYYYKPDWEDNNPEYQAEYRAQQLKAEIGTGRYKVSMITSAGVERVISTWKFYEMPHCCAYLVSCNVQITNDFRGKGIGTLLNLMRIDFGSILGYSAMLCTDIEKNVQQRAILAKNGWKDVHSIKNKRTSNLVFLSVINLK